MFIWRALYQLVFLYPAPLFSYKLAEIQILYSSSLQDDLLVYLLILATV